MPLSIRSLSRSSDYPQHQLNTSHKVKKNNKNKNKNKKKTNKKKI